MVKMSNTVEISQRSGTFPASITVKTNAESDGFSLEMERIGPETATDVFGKKYAAGTAMPFRFDFHATKP